METNIIKALKPPNISELKKFEKIKQLEIPNELQEFWIKYNAIYLKNNIYLSDGNKYYLDRFYPFDKNYELSFQYVYENLKDYLQDSYLAFANDCGDWQYVISINTDSYGCIFFCRMDDMIPDSLVKIANNFEEFIDGLQAEE